MRLFVLLCLLVVCSPAFAGKLSGMVIRVVDGDTIKIATPKGKEIAIRLASVDAPEYDQPHGEISKQFLTRIALKQWVEAECYGKDPFKRRVCRVEIDGADIAVQLLLAGMVYIDVRYLTQLNSLLMQVYVHSETNARIGKKGVWEDKTAVFPWEWRNGVR